MNIYDRILLRQDNILATAKHMVKAKAFIESLSHQRQLQCNKMIKVSLYNTLVISVALLLPVYIKVTVLLTSLLVTGTIEYILYNRIQSIDCLIDAENKTLEDKREWPAHMR